MHTRCNITQLWTALSLAFLALSMCTMTLGMILATTAKPALYETTTASSHQGNSSTLIDASSQKNVTNVNIVPVKNSTTTGQGPDDKRTSRYYSPFSSGYEDQFNPFPNYYPAALGGFNGVGVLASSCAYAYPNRRYSCYGLGRR